MATTRAVAETSAVPHWRSRTAGRFLSSIFSILAVLLLLGGAGMAAQSASGEVKAKADYALIAGTVWTADDHPAYGVPVKIRRATDKPNKGRWELMSDHSGEFAQRVPVGTADYIVWADIKTKKGEPKPETRVHIENNERVDIGIHLPQ